MPYGRLEKLFAKKSLGQNFLVDQDVVGRIIAAVDPKESDLIIEIGPGRGALTEKLLERARRLYALEFDARLAPLLREQFADKSNFALVEGDALSFNFRSLVGPGERLRLVANLPYNISTAILQRLFDFGELFSDCVLMFQREVVERIAAVPGTKDRGYLTILTEAHFAVERLFDVPPEAFRPMPKVWSSVVRLVPRQLDLVHEAYFREFIGTAFGQKRKTILNNLKTKYPNAQELLDSAGVEPNRRAETLTLAEWLKLTEVKAAGR